MVRSVSQIERDILRSTKEFAENNDIHFDEMTSNMILNAMRQYQFQIEQIELNKKLEEMATKKEYEMKFTNTGFDVWVSVDIKDSKIPVEKAIELGFLRIKE